MAPNCTSRDLNLEETMARTARSVFERIGKEEKKEAIKIQSICFNFVGVVLYLVTWLILTVGWLFPLGAFITGALLGGMKVTFHNALVLLSAMLGYWIAVALWQTIQPWGYSSQTSWLVVPLFLAGCGLTLFVRFRAKSQPTVT